MTARERLETFAGSNSQRPYDLLGQDIQEVLSWARVADLSAENLALDVEALEEALDLVDTPYPLEVFPERTDEQRDAIFAAMRTADMYATEWFYAHVARERGRVARDYFRAARSPSRTERGEG